MPETSSNILELNSPLGARGFAEIIIPLALPKNYTWSVPDHLKDQLHVGCRVEVNLGKNKKYAGIIKTILHKNELKKFEKTKILKRYDDWSYSNPFKFENGILIFPAPKLRSMRSYLSDYCESHVMVWIKINNINGHYYLREKSSSEKFFDRIRNDDDLKINDYECFTITKSHFVIQINQILKNFQNERRLEIEIDNDNLFIKTDRLVNLEDILRIEKIIKRLTKPSLNNHNSINIK